MTIQLEEGKRGRTRDGRETGPFKRSNDRLNFVADVSNDVSDFRLYSKSGAWLFRGAGEHDLDIVELIEDEPQTEELTLKVGEEYEDDEFIIKIIGSRTGDYGEIFVGWFEGLSEYFEYRSDGQGVKASTANLIKKHTPPVEVKPLWVVVNALGSATVRFDKDNAATWANGWQQDNKGPCDVQRIELTYQGGRRDDLEASDE